MDNTETFGVLTNFQCVVLFFVSTHQKGCAWPASLALSLGTPPPGHTAVAPRGDGCLVLTCRTPGKETEENILYKNKIH